MNGYKLQLAILAVHMTLGLSVIVAATVLGSMHILDAEGVTAIFGSALGFGGAGATAAGVRLAQRAAEADAQ